MSFYIAIAGEKRGPFPAYRIIDQLRGGELSPDALGWEQGMGAWLKLREIPTFAEAIERLEKPFPANPSPDIADEPAPPAVRAARSTETPAPAKSSGIPVAAEVRPFTRFWARTFDYMIVSTIVILFFELPAIPPDVPFWEVLRQLTENEQFKQFAITNFIAMVCWHGLEGILLHVWGTTPGKAVFSIRITQADGGPVSLGAGVARSFLAWGAGLGFGFAPVNFLGMALALLMLLLQGATLWDRVLGTRVHHQPMTTARILVAVAGFLLLMVISSLKFSPS
jgi:uncharacterized RDD family membrane protein YckC